MKLTITQVRQLPKPQKGFTEYTIGSVMGLKVRIHASGVRSWVFKYKAHGKQNVITLGRVDAVSVKQAESEACNLRLQVQAGHDPAAQARREREAAVLAEAQRKADESANPTFHAVAEEYLERYAKQRKKSWQRDAGNLKQHIIPFIGNIRIKHIKRSDINRILDAIRDRGSMAVANRIRALLSSIFNWSIRRDYTDTNPVTHTERTKEKPRDRVLTESEVRHLWENSEGSMAGLVLRFCLLSGKRLGEVLGIRWTDIQDGVIRITDTKNGSADVVPVSSGMRMVLDAARHMGKGGAFVFGGRTGKPLTHRTVDLKMAALWDAEDKLRPRVHDLRRTAATLISMLGAGREVVKHILNHADNSVTAIYDRYGFLQEKRKALGNLWIEIQRIVGGNVVTLPQPKGAVPYRSSGLN